MLSKTQVINYIIVYFASNNLGFKVKVSDNNFSIIA
jgi:hypothetical protein